MLTDKEKAEILVIASHYQEKRAACIEAMRSVQRHRGWISDAMIRSIAEALDMSPDDVDGVATFYNLIFRRPVGRHIIAICDSMSCYVMGYEAIVRYLEEKWNLRFGDTTPDRRFTLIPVGCLGTCDHAPALMIDGDTYQDVTLTHLEEILKKYP